MATELRPKKPIKKPKPKKINFIDGNFGWIDAEDEFAVGTTLFTCTDEFIPVFDEVKPGTYTLETGESVVIGADGVIDEIG